MTRLRLRIRYSVDGPLRYVSHLEQMRIWERAARQAGLPLAYSEGFNPRPRIQIAAALAVGFAADAELLDLWLTQPADAEAVGKALAHALPDGLCISHIEWANPDEPPLPAQVQAAEYGVTVETERAEKEVRQRIESLLAAESLPRQRRGRRYDLRPLILRLWLEAICPGETTLGMVLLARQGATGRPEEVLDAMGLAGGFFRVRRRRILLGT